MSLRVLQVSKEFEPSSSGVARHIQGLVRAMAADGQIALTILAPNIDAADGPWRLLRGGYSRLWSAIGVSDLVHVHGARTPFAAVAGALARIRGVPLVYTPHCYYDTGSWWLRQLKKIWDLTVERALVRSAGAVVLLHEGWVPDLAARGLHPAKVLIVPNCIDDRCDIRPSVSPALEGAPALLSVGRLDPVKRLDDVIAALAVPTLAHAVLHIVGRGPDQQRLTALVAQRGLSARVRFHGWQDDDATARMMAGCAVMVLASEREGMPTVVLEALLAGVPIACSDIEGCRAIVNAVGWDAVFPVGDPVALGECVARTAGRKVPNTVVQAVRSRFTWQRTAARLAETYIGLAAQAHTHWSQ